MGNESGVIRQRKTGKKSKEINENEKECEKLPEEKELTKVESPPNDDKLSARVLRINIEIDLISLCLFAVALGLRLYRLEEPRNIVFDELHYGKYVSMYMKRTFFFDPHPPLGKQMIAAVAYLAGFDGNCKFERIGNPYPENVPLFSLRFIPALCGSLVVPIIYNIILEIGFKPITAILASVLILSDNALLTQSRFMLMESIQIMFTLFGILCLLYFRKSRTYSISWYFWLSLAFVSLTCGACVKYSGIYGMLLGFGILVKFFWDKLGKTCYSDWALMLMCFIQSLVAVVSIVMVYVGVFYIHLSVLNKAGPHDSVMTSAFQASLEGGLASITKGQPIYISHGSQITLRHTHGRTCWLHSHGHVYPVRYSDKRGSSHQQQVTCYSFKDVNNWWIVKRPNLNDLVVGDEIDKIKHNDVIQLVHGITSRALNSHDVAAPISPQCQEVSCYIDYNVSMPPQNLWKVDIINNELSNEWLTIQSHVRLIHLNSSQALRFTGRQLPDWGFNQHEIVTDKIINQDDTVWNVEEHRYTKSDDQKERERDLVNAEMIPTQATQLTFWSKFVELQKKMLFSSPSSDQSHMYSSEPLEWPTLTRGIAYYVATNSNAQVHLLGNIVIWYSGTISIFIYSSILVFYLLRRRRKLFDIPEQYFDQFVFSGEIFLIGYIWHYVPYFFVERTLFLHHYLPAFIFKVLLLVALIHHIYLLLENVKMFKYLYFMIVICYCVWVVQVFMKFMILSYGLEDLTMSQILKLRWKDSWDFIIHRN